ncbi:prolyl oligopeptidase family serine peptidase [Thalassotalea nanhaiensis]|uniref:Prolyl oligopeptidase family serine peptidase n=1 Tax=Thalassotalea nanhaiensis TaxID=3065648 RepID=A0ABY9TEN5_9GAMM|nr:prolyl oligopeptidase family serine peptidase [Colwelliaceae bacterium SQ345]
MFKKSPLFLLLMLFSICFSANANNWSHLFDRPEYLGVKISPDGNHLAVKILKDDKPALAFIERATMKVTGSAILPGNNEVGYYEWVNNERVVIQINQREPWSKESYFYGELYAINKDSSKAKLIYGYRAGSKQVGSNIKKNQQIIGWAQVIDFLPEDDKHILISSTPQSRHSDVIASIFKIDVYTGKIKQKLGKGPAPKARFITDVDGNLKVATAIDKNYNRQAYLKKGDEWHQIPEANFGQYFTPLTVNQSGEHLYVIDNFEQDIAGLFKLNLTDGSYKHILTDKKVDISAVNKTVDKRNVYALRVDDEFPAYYMLNKSLPEAKVFKKLVASFPGHVIDITSQTEDGKLSIVRTSSDIEAGTFYLFDNEKNSLSLMFKYYPNLDSNKLVYTDPIKFTTSDNLEISGLFTQGKVAKKGEIAPLIVYVHGGPHARDYWGFDATNQYLALNGYSVLQINFRGSSGYGSTFEEAGYRNWGSAIQQDILEAYNWAINTGKAEKGKACVMGASFGGYSAVQSAINYPDTYKCAVAYAGVYDLEFMYDEGNIKRLYSGKSYLEKTLGTDETVLKAMSPVHGVDKINIPLLIAHGELDKQVPFEHSERLIDALDESNKEYIWYPIEGEGHGFFDPEDKKEYMNNVLKFLNEHLM